MNKLMLTILTALLMVAGLITGSPASASEGRYFSANACESYSNVAMCFQGNWDRQADGTGVRLERYKASPTNGCDTIQQFEDVNGFWIDPSDNRVDYRYDLGTEQPCTIYRDVSNAGSDTGPMVIKLTFKVAIRGRQDGRWSLAVKLFPDGSSQVTQEYVEGVPLFRERVR